MSECMSEPFNEELEELEKLFAEAAALVDPMPPPVPPASPANRGHAPERVQLVPLPSGRPPSAAASSEAPVKPLMRPAVPVLTVLDDGSHETGQEIRIRQECFTIGRCAGDLVLPNDPALSAQHAELRLTVHRGLPRWVLHDTGSTNQTFVRVNGVRLYPDSVMILGMKRYRLQTSGSRLPQATGPRPDATCLVAKDIPPAHPGAELVEICGGTGGVFPLVASRMAIGRDATRCPIRVDDPALAGLHAELLREADGSWRIVAAPSRNGVWVSTRSTRLTSCCYFQCGEQRFRFVVP